MIAVFHIKFIFSVLNIYMICLTQKRTNKVITYEFARSASTAVVILRSKKNSLVEFSINIAC